MVTATSSATPVVRREWLAAGAHVNAVGACVPGDREIDTATMAEAAVFADRRESVLTESGDYLLAAAEGAGNPVRAELGELLLGTAPGRASDDEITLFESLGLAAEDLAAASYLYQKALRHGAGTTVDFSSPRSEPGSPHAGPPERVAPEPQRPHPSLSGLRANYIVVTTTRTRRHGCHNHVVRSAVVAEAKELRQPAGVLRYLGERRGGHNGGRSDACNGNGAESGRGDRSGITGGDPRSPRNVRPPGYHRQAIRLPVPESFKRAEVQWLTGLSFAAPASTT